MTASCDPAAKAAYNVGMVKVLQCRNFLEGTQDFILIEPVEGHVLQSDLLASLGVLQQDGFTINTVGNTRTREPGQ